MDLSFRLPDPAAREPARGSELSDADMAVLVGLLAERQAESATAQAQSAIDAPAAADALLAPVDGAFNAAMATRMTQWKQE